MNTGKRTNEELVIVYRITRDESYLAELIKQNRGLLYMIVEPFVHSIPNAELEDLTSEAYIPMLRAIEDFDEARGLTFANLLKVYVRQHLSRLYNEATRQKRYNGSTSVGYESLTEINREGGSEGDSYFTVDCEDFNSVEFMQFINSLELNEKETVAVNVLMAGGTKGEVAKALKCTPATANYYFKQIRRKFVLAGYAL
ncbi:sigma factor [Hominenteromicrobium sp.]|jgi:RNA polymerase nonessential primary-like sigma factor|uniref:sigma factor n=1 Tax=Hominenteromicrobium sp. TaxID=3073581 RepID=UPI00205AF068|nr:MAG TPA: Sigma-70 region 2 [Caudoviricetes sp.]